VSKGGSKRQGQGRRAVRESKSGQEREFDAFFFVAVSKFVP